MNNDLTLRVINNTTEKTTLLLSHQNSSLSEAWKVFPLKGTAEYVLRQGSVVYSSGQSIGVLMQKGTPEPMISKEVHPGDQLAFSLDEQGAPYLSLLPDKNPGGQISCQNDTQGTVSIGLYNSGSALFTASGVVYQQTVSFLLPSRLYALYSDTIEAAQTALSGDTATIELTNSRFITATLMSENGIKRWLVQYL